MFGRLIVKAVNLLEAEGRLARRSMVRLMEMLWLQCVLAAMWLGGLAVFALGLYDAIAMWLNRPVAGIVVGVLLMFGAAIAMLAMRPILFGESRRGAVRYREPGPPREDGDRITADRPRRTSTRSPIHSS